MLGWRGGQPPGQGRADVGPVALDHDVLALPDVAGSAGAGREVADRRQIARYPGVEGNVPILTQPGRSSLIWIHDVDAQDLRVRVAHEWIRGRPDASQ